MYCALQTFLFFQFIFIDSYVLNKMFLFKFRRVTKQRKTAKVNRRKKFTLLLFFDLCNLPTAKLPMYLPIFQRQAEAFCRIR